MSYFIGIVPPEDYKQKIVAFQKMWPGNKLPGYVNPHITLKAPTGLKSDLKWIDDIKTVLAGYRPFNMKIGGPAFFDKEVLYLQIFSDTAQRIHEQIIAALLPKLKVNLSAESERFNMHLTLATVWSGNNWQELLKMQGMADKFLAPYPQFTVQSIRVFEKHTPKNSYHTFCDIDLKN